MEIQELISFTTIVQQGSFSKATKNGLATKDLSPFLIKILKENLVYNYLIQLR